MFLINCLTITSLLVSANSQRLQEQRIQSYQSCRVDADCKINSFCYGNDDDRLGKCKCLNGFDLIRNSTFYECLPAIPLGEACDKNVQCQITASKLAFCNEYKICECNSESHPKNGVCYATVKLGEVCLVDYNCLLGDNKTYASCADGRCSCPADKLSSVDGTRCIDSRTLGQPCKSDDECSSVPNTACLDKCRCATGYTLSRDETACIKAATNFFDPCDYDGQCSALLQLSVCTNRQCTCSSSYHNYGSRCVLTRKPGERCEEVAQCVFEKKMQDNVECVNGVCSCIFGTNKTDGFCNIEKVADNSAVRTSFALFTITFLFITKWLIYC